MSVESFQHEELVQLLELLCEDRLARAQAASTFIEPAR